MKTCKKEYRNCLLLHSISTARVYADPTDLFRYMVLLVTVFTHMPNATMPVSDDIQ